MANKWTSLWSHSPAGWNNQCYTEALSLPSLRQLFITKTSKLRDSQSPAFPLQAVNNGHLTSKWYYKKRKSEIYFLPEAQPSWKENTWTSKQIIDKELCHSLPFLESNLWDPLGQLLPSKDYWRYKSEFEFQTSAISWVWKEQKTMVLRKAHPFHLVSSYWTLRR